MLCPSQNDLQGRRVRGILSGTAHDYNGNYSGNNIYKTLSYYIEVRWSLRKVIVITCKPVKFYNFAQSQVVFLNTVLQFHYNVAPYSLRHPPMLL